MRLSSYWYAALFPLPDDISWTAIRSGELIFSWNTVTSDCAAISYKISTTNCGNCPTNTTHTTVTCTDVPTDGSLCTFALQMLVCHGTIDQNISYVLQRVWLKGIYYKCHIVLNCQVFNNWISGHLKDNVISIRPYLVISEPNYS